MELPSDCTDVQLAEETIVDPIETERSNDDTERRMQTVELVDGVRRSRGRPRLGTVIGLSNLDDPQQQPISLVVHRNRRRRERRLLRRGVNTGNCKSSSTTDLHSSSNNAK